jgi:hypothetical protein
LERDDITDPNDQNDRSEATPRQLPIDASEAAEPIEPMERTDPMEPIDRIDPLELTDRIEFVELIDHLDVPCVRSMPPSLPGRGWLMRSPAS